MKIVAIVLARFNSSRLFGKAMLPLNGKPMIQRCLEATKHSKFINQTIVATSSDAHDDVIASNTHNLGYSLYRGSLDDVLDRFNAAAKKFNADIAVYIGGDSPLLDIAAIDNAIQILIEEEYDFVSNYETPTFANGHDVNVITASALEKLNKSATMSFERTNIFSYISFHPHQFKSFNQTSKDNFSTYQLAVDEEDDYENIKEIIQILDDHKVDKFTFQNLKSLANKNIRLKRLLNKQNKLEKCGHALFSSRKIINEIISELGGVLIHESKSSNLSLKNLKKVSTILSVINEKI